MSDVTACQLQAAALWSLIRARHSERDRTQTLARAVVAEIRLKVSALAAIGTRVGGARATEAPAEQPTAAARRLRWCRQRWQHSETCIEARTAHQPPAVYADGAQEHIGFGSIEWAAQQTRRGDGATQRLRADVACDALLQSAESGTHLVCRHYREIGA